MENYEQKYKEALERARSYYNNEEARVGMTPIELEEIFPELGENEDEKIRKQLIHYFEYLKPYVPPIKDCFGDEYGYEIPEFIAWLEKQAPSEKAIEYLAKNHSSSEISDFQAAINIATAKAYDKGYNDGLGKQREQDNWAEELNTKIKELNKQCIEIIQKYVSPCDGCNNYKGCVDCVEGDQRAKITEESKFKVGDGVVHNDACVALTKKMLYDIILDLKVFRDKDCSMEGKAAYQREIDWLENLKKELEDSYDQ